MVVIVNFPLSSENKKAAGGASAGGLVVGPDRDLALF
jgi:hypothetical protein